MINNEDAFWDWFKKYKNISNFQLELLDEGYVWSALNSQGIWEGSDMWFDTPYDALVDFFSNLVSCEIV